jgi:hypothetical protein
MLALEIEKDDVKNFMGKLLREELFGAFEMRTAEILAATKITIDGALESGEFATWGATRPLIFEIIKMNKKPRHMKIIFASHSPNEIHQNAAALFLNFTYDNDSVSFTTATAQKEFALDKSLDSSWDIYVRNFFAKINVDVKDRA